MGVDVMALDAAFLGTEVESELVEVASEIAAFMGDLLSVLLGGFGAVEQRLDVVDGGKVQIFGEVDISAFDLVEGGGLGVWAWVEFFFDGALEFFVGEAVAVTKDLGQVATKGMFGVEVIE